jgi:hypothetical protein
MADEILTRLYDNHSDAIATVRALEDAGFGHDHIGIVTSHGAHEAHLGTENDPTINEAADIPPDASPDHTRTGIGAGATIGTVIGGGLGLMAGVGALLIPGFGPVVAAGWLLSTLTGAGIGAALGSTTGGIAAALVDLGVAEDDAHAYADGVRNGGTLITARVETARRIEAERILDHKESGRLSSN